MEHARGVDGGEPRRELLEGAREAPQIGRAQRAVRIGRGLDHRDLAERLGPGAAAPRARGARAAGRQRLARRREPLLERALRRRDVVEQVDPLQEVHREEPGVVHHDEIAEANEVRVLQIGERPKLALEPHDHRHVAVLEPLERHLGPALVVVRGVDHAERPRAEAPMDREPRGRAKDLWQLQAHRARLASPSAPAILFGRVVRLS